MVTETIGRGTAFTTAEGREAEVEAVRGDVARVKIRIAPRRIIRRLFKVADIETLVNAQAQGIRLTAYRQAEMREPAEKLAQMFENLPDGQTIDLETMDTINRLRAALDTLRVS